MKGTAMLRVKALILLLIAALVAVALSPAAAASPSDASIIQVEQGADLWAGETASFKWVVYNDGADRMLVIPRMMTSLPERLSYTLEPTSWVLDPHQGFEVYLNVSARNDMYPALVQASVVFNVTDMVSTASEEFASSVSLNVRSIYAFQDRENRILGIWDNFLPAPLDGNLGAFGVSILIWLVVAFVVFEVFGPSLRRLTARSATKWDDIIIDVVKWPLFLLLLAYGTVSSLEILELNPALVADLELAYLVALVLIAALLAYRILVKMVLCWGKERCDDPRSGNGDVMVNGVELLGKVVIPVAAAFIIAGILGMDLGGAILGVGFLGLIVGYATKSTLSNLFSGLQLLVDRPFKIGDRVPLEDGHTAQVLSVGLLTTKLLDLDTSEEVIVPNSLLESQVIINMNAPDTRFKVSVKVRVSDREDPRRIEELMMEASRRTPQILQGGNAPVVRVSEVKEGRMMLTIFLWVDDVANRHIARTEYRSNLYQVLGENGVEIAIPRNRVWLNREQVRGP